MTKLFVLEKIKESSSSIALLSIAMGNDLDNQSVLFLDRISFKKDDLKIELVSDVVEADYFLVPQAINKIDNTTSHYLKKNIELAKKYNKKIIVFVGGDLSHNIFIDDSNVIVLKGSQYKHLKRKNEIIIPPLVEDLGSESNILHGKNPVPIVGFCGWAGFDNLGVFIKYLAKNLLLDLISFIPGQKSVQVFKKGLFFRRKVIKILLKSKKIQTNFIIRKTFSGNRKTISGEADRLRNEYIENIKSSDMILAPKGDGNFSLRFYEVISLSRIPVLLDTDLVLPFGDFIDYKEFCLIVPFDRINSIDSFIYDFYERLSESELIRMQKNARRFFQEYLRYDSFFNKLFSKRLEDWL